MKCPFCGRSETKVIESRLNQLGDITRRRRECEGCEGRFTTHERIEPFMPVIIKKDGRRETYDREKMITGIVKACQKRPIQTEQIERLVQDVEKQIAAEGLKEVPASHLGHLVMEALLKLDKVAYIRFASVYREFRDVEEFFSELREDQEKLRI